MKKPQKTYLTRIPAGSAAAVHLAVVVACIGLFLLVVRLFPVPPAVDPLEHWRIAGDLSLYSKGGVMITVYSVLQGLEPHIAAALVNTASFAVIGILLLLPADVRKKTLQTQYLFTAVTLLLGLWLSGFAPLVATELPHLAFGLLAIRIMIHILLNGPSWLAVVGAAAAGAASVSIRLQTMLPVLFILTAVSGYVVLKRIRLTRSVVACIAVLILSVTGGRLIDAVYRMGSQVPERLAAHEMQVALNGVTPGQCGLNTRAGTAYLAEPLETGKGVPQAYVELFSQQTPKDLAANYACKLDYWLSLRGSSWIMVSRHLNPLYSEDFEEVRNTNSSPMIRAALHLEAVTGTILYLIMIVLAVLLFKEKRSSLGRLLLLGSLLLFSGYTMQHMIIEINTRYIVPPMVFSLYLLLYGYALRDRSVKKIAEGSEKSVNK
ncbi:MAG: hypothetical protein TR69_WS6001001417 [candidate division WS6 bacterium OLB20]|uniref:Uncharacterized protein n=1 Tax=candidate division WS6 bacterium OLB20 TaxID=1617426 RepID=A0A136LVX7_9BACT|nr:MAG: hypothetical protein TR69_WS6001001417 [candidate division WS6 bacterium OLB20]